MSFHKQGLIGLIDAIKYFVKEEYTISEPIGENQHYDLIVDKDKKLSKIQVKTTTYKCNRTDKRNAYYEINIKNKKYVKESFDYLFAINIVENKKYLIPINFLNLNNSKIYLTPKFDKYVVE